jgi:hypothetical protein
MILDCVRLARLVSGLLAFPRPHARSLSPPLAQLPPASLPSLASANPKDEQRGRRETGAARAKSRSITSLRELTLPFACTVSART